MKLISPINFMVTLVFLCGLLLMAGSASAHRVNVFAWVEGDMIHVEGKFASGKIVKAGKIVVMDPQGVELLSGLTGDQGEFSFKVPRRTDLRIVLIAGQGHQGEWIIRADEMNDLPLETTSETSTQIAAQPKPKEADPETSPEIAISPNELEAIIDSALDRKLEPITRMLADMRQEGPSVGDVFAGIGYILGLVGIAAYVHSRKKKV
jgi:nickel transport protein